MRGEAVAGRPVKAWLGPQLAGQPMQALHEIAVQTVGDVQPQAVHTELALPHAHGVQQVIDDLGVAKVELDQVLVALPALVPKAVAEVRVPVEADVEPVLVRGVPLALARVAEGPEIAAHMVEHGVDDHAHAACVQGVDHMGKVLVGTQAAVDLTQVAGVVAVRVAGEHGVEQDGTHIELTQVWGPFDERAHAMEGAFSLLAPGVVDRGGVERAPEHAQRVHLVERRVENPHGSSSDSKSGTLALTSIPLSQSGRAHFSAGGCHARV